MLGYFSYASKERVALKSTLDNIALHLPETVIFGGMLREFALGNARSFTSDIDLVSLASRKEIQDAISDFKPTENKFGGFRFVAADRLFDVWAFEDTWAIRAGFIRGRDFKDLLKTTFFNLDAAAFHIGTHEFLYMQNFSRALQDKLLDMNLEENPCPDRMAWKAIKMATEKDLALSKQLSVYILEHVNRKKLDYISKKFVQRLDEHVNLDKKDIFRFNPQLSLL